MQLIFLPVDGFRGFGGFPEVISSLAFALITSTRALISLVWCNRTLCMFVNSQQLLNFSSNFFSARFRKSFKSVWKKMVDHTNYNIADLTAQAFKYSMNNALWGKA